ALGVELKNNIKQAWWHDMVRNPPPGPDGQEISMVGVDCSIIMNPKVWEASGHVGGFADPMQTCRQCKKHLRADQIVKSLLEAEWAMALDKARQEMTSWLDLKRWVLNKGKKLAPHLLVVREPERVFQYLENLDTGQLRTSLEDLVARLGTAREPNRAFYEVCPNCGGDLMEPRQFNLMFETYI